MDFHSEFFPKSLKIKIEHWNKLFLIGSCFTEQIGNKFASHKFHILQNPNGILFNPVSIASALSSYISRKVYKENDLFCHNEIWSSWQHHSRFSGLQKESVLEQINASQKEASEFVTKANWLMITLGSAFVYEKADQSHKVEVVANCHKIPPDKFKKRLLDPAEIKAIFISMLAELKTVNPDIKVIFTISPVRHLREGFVENNRSKAALIQAVHDLTNDSDIFYFPAYELIIDDLRDYRFYAEDLVHPNYQATNYVWEKFISSCVDERALEIMKQINEINAAVRHKPFNPLSDAHAKFIEGIFVKINALLKRHTYLDFTNEFLLLNSSSGK